jgi:hypothetical protein
MSKTRKVPEIRFKGYADVWEQRKLDCTNTVFTDGNYGESYPKSSDMTDSISGVPFLTGGNLRDGKLSINGASYITLDKHLELTSGHLEEDDIVIAVRGSLGALGYVNYNNAGWNINSQLAILRTNKNELYGAFLIQYLLSQDGQNALLKRQTGSALKQLPIKSLKDLKVPISSIDEQKEIANFLSQLDNRITLHQRKYDQVVNFKKAMLEKMFPKNGSDTPEIRFKEFSDENIVPWIKKNLKDESIEIIAGGDINTSLLKNKGKYPVVANALTHNGIVGYYDDFFRVKAPAVTVTGRGDVGHAKARLVDFTPVVRLISIKSNHNVLFLENSINTLNIVVESTGVPQLTVPQLSKYDLYFPPTINEEEVVGDFFNKIDTLINSYQCKLQKLKNIKKALLEKMFV